MSNKTLFEVNQELRAKFKTVGNTYDMFPVGSTVRVICAHQDHEFFDCDKQNTYGTVIRNDHTYLGIVVKWVKPEQHHGASWNFDPNDLVLIDDPKHEAMWEEVDKHFMDGVREILNSNFMDDVEKQAKNEIEYVIARHKK